MQIPQSDLDEGRATKRTLLKEEMEAIPKFAIHVQSADKRPPAEEVYAAVHYHGHWFWIEDRDLSSKRGMSFMLGLFTAGGIRTSRSSPVADHFQTLK